VRVNSPPFTPSLPCTHSYYHLSGLTVTRQSRKKHGLKTVSSVDGPACHIIYSNEGGRWQQGSPSSSLVFCSLALTGWHGARMEAPTSARRAKQSNHPGCSDCKAKPSGSLPKPLSLAPAYPHQPNNLPHPPPFSHTHTISSARLRHPRRHPLSSLRTTPSRPLKRCMRSAQSAQHVAERAIAHGQYTHPGQTPCPSGVDFQRCAPRRKAQMHL
jgi:hypothetical protein